MTEDISATQSRMNGVAEQAQARRKETLRQSLLTRIGEADPDRRAALEAGWKDAQAFQKTAKSGSKTAEGLRRDAALQKIDHIKWQIEFWQFAGGDAKTRGRKLQRLAQQLDTVPKMYQKAARTNHLYKPVLNRQITPPTFQNPLDVTV